MGPAVQHPLHDIADRRQRRIELLDRRCFLARMRDEQGQRVEQAAQARIMGQTADQRLCRDQLLRHLLDLLGRQEQQPVLIEKRSAIRLTDIGEQRGLGAHPVGELTGRAVGEIRGLPVDDDNHEIVVLREGEIQRALALAPCHIARQHPIDARVDRQPVGGEKPGGERQRQHHDHHQRGPAPGEIDDVGDDGGDHAAPPPVTFRNIAISGRLRPLARNGRPGAVTDRST